MLLRVASFNIHHGVGVDGVLDLHRTAEVVRATGAEVVGLQEVDRHLSPRSGWVDQAGWLAAELEMHVAHGANIDLDPDERRGPDAPRRHYGNAVMSTYPLDAWDNVPLPGRHGAEPRGLLTVRLTLGDSQVVVGCTHLQNRSSTDRLAQAVRVVEVLTPPAGTAPATSRPATADPTILLGDMNAGPEAAAVRTLTATFTDVWAATNPVRYSATDPAAGATDPVVEIRPGSDGLTFDAATPHARIDYVLISGPIRPQAAWVVPTAASDHRPVVADIVI